MKLSAVAESLSARVIHGTDEQLQQEVHTAAASDMMSDVLARRSTPDLMLTGLATLQAIRTPAVAGIKAVVIVRGKPVDEKLVEVAREEDIVLMSTDKSLFDASGLLYEAGMRSAALKA